ncbi:MAG: prephenate/arogenate dehydrogenase family protein [Rhodobacteraceae bacterium]|nr:prephenate/arogenate dehydrogenase family protein [Paracoccaceae bacterium]
MSQYKHVALIGLGLLASSISLAMRRADMAARITGTARSKETQETALEIGLVDAVFDTAAEAVKGADLVILCVPVGVMGAIAEEIAPHLSEGCTVSDVGSVKRAVAEAIRPHMPDGVHLIPAHPMAGTEKSGPEAGFASLFDNRWLLITPLPESDHTAVKRLVDFWTTLGSNVEIMEIEHHDLVAAVISHTPHLIAYTMVGVADGMNRVAKTEVVNYSAAGFRDFTRIAASDPTMWRDVFLNNKDATLEVLGRFTEELFALQRAIRLGDGDFLFDYFTRTRDIRRSIIDAGQDTEAADFGRTKSEK